MRWHEAFHHRLAFTLLLSVWLYALAGGVGPARAADGAAAQDPCGLVTAAEAETVLGEPLAGPPFRASNREPDVAGDTCRYEMSGFRAVVLRVEWKNGGRTFGLMNMVGSVASNGGLKGVVTLSNGTALHGAWDEARLFQCCEFNALRGDQLVVVDVSGSSATVKQAAALADLAVKRLDQPLSIDDTAGRAAAEERAKARPAIVSACDLVPRAEAEAIIGGPLATDPQGDEASCDYAWVAPGTGSQQQMTLSVTWRGGLSEMRTTLAQMGQALKFIASQGLSSDQKQQSGTGPFDEEASSMIGVMGVRKDVLLSIETGGTGNDIASAFIAAAAKEL